MDEWWQVRVGVSGDGFRGWAKMRFDGGLSSQRRIHCGLIYRFQSIKARSVTILVLSNNLTTRHISQISEL